MYDVFKSVVTGENIDRCYLIIACVSISVLSFQQVLDSLQTDLV